MRINCHTHLFNLQAVFTTQTLQIFINRIKEMELPKFILDILSPELERVLVCAGDYVDEEKVIRRLVAELCKTEQVRDIIDDLSKDELGLDRLDDLAAYGLMKFFDWLGKKMTDNEGDAKKQTLLDIIEFVRIALQPNIKSVTERLMSQINADDAVIALMMDITYDGSEKGLFEKQIQDTSNMILSYPGRIFPFFAVNPHRPDHYQIMLNALQGRGFVGIKLYPSLGYPINSEAMERVYTYCEENETPILMHCNPGGFYYKDEFCNNSSPDYWDDILQKHKNLKVCFGLSYP